MNTEQNEIMSQVEEAIQAALAVDQPEPVALPYSNIDEYRQVTGKRFRIHPDEVAQGLTREQAFAQRVLGQPPVA